MIRVKNFNLYNIKDYVFKTKKQLKMGTGEILDFKGWKPLRQALELEVYLKYLELNTETSKKLIIKNVNPEQKEQVIKSLEKVLIENREGR